MIVPSKGIPPRRALLTIGGEIVEALSEPKTVSRLWTEIRDSRAQLNDAAIGFDWFVLALDLARCLDAIRLTADGFLVRTQP